ncbi:MAG: class I SAM-dependent methyltransferase, partial [Muribaculaceae bacterium]|nr:class I SAM-dependent methyltransferase [Muribaculaceae bacterium]
MQTIKKYFPNLTQLQIMQFEQLGPLYTHWNSAINVISRKDIQNLYPNHVLHSLAIAEFLGPLETDTRIMD